MKPLASHLLLLLLLGLTTLALAGGASPAGSHPGEQPRRAAPVSYDGFKAVRLVVPSGAGDDDDGAVHGMMAAVVDRLALATWKTTHRFVDVVVPPGKLAALTAEMPAGVEVVVMHEDLGASIAAERGTLGGTGIASRAVDDTWFDSYHAYADHLAWLTELQAQFPGNSEVVTAGASGQGQAITGIHIFGGSGGGTNPAVVFHGTVHAREWITTMVTEFLAYSLLANYSSSPEIEGYVDKYDFYIFPVVNPDGFTYTQTTDRLWRKNRQPNAGSSCRGVDINRNWPFEWDVPGGATSDPCGQTYKGAAAGDTVENQALRATLDGLAAGQGVKLYIDWHSYSQLFMFPYGYNCTVVAADDAEFAALARGGAAAIAAPFGTAFDTGPVCTTIYQATGVSVDYVYNVTGADYVFTLELRDMGQTGFVLPPEQIRASGLEAYEGVKYLLANMK